MVERDYREAGRIGISDEQFWRMTPRRLALYAEGYSERLEDKLETDSIMTSYIVQAFTGEDIKPSDLFRRSGDEPEIDEEQRHREFIETCAALDVEPYTEDD